MAASIYILHMPFQPFSMCLLHVVQKKLHNHGTTAKFQPESTFKSAFLGQYRKGKYGNLARV